MVPLNWWKQKENIQFGLLDTILSWSPQKQGSVLPSAAVVLGPVWSGICPPLQTLAISTDPTLHLSIHLISSS